MTVGQEAVFLSNVEIDIIRKFLVVLILIKRKIFESKGLNERNADDI